MGIYAFLETFFGAIFFLPGTMLMMGVINMLRFFFPTAQPAWP